MQQVILFDGVCNLCNGSIRFISKRDKRNIFRFIPLQSDMGKSILEKYNFPTSDFNTIVLVKNDTIYTKSSAALEIVRHLSGLWPLFSFFKIIPTPLRDWCYAIVAERRYFWFGRTNECELH